MNPVLYLGINQAWCLGMWACKLTTKHRQFWIFPIKIKNCRRSKSKKKKEKSKHKALKWSPQFYTTLCTCCLIKANEQNTTFLCTPLNGSLLETIVFSLTLGAACLNREINLWTCDILFLLTFRPKISQ